LTASCGLSGLDQGACEPFSKHCNQRAAHSVAQRWFSLCIISPPLHEDGVATDAQQVRAKKHQAHISFPQQL
jgi:hypothetical protein